MLHLEIYRSAPEVSENYSGGNWFKSTTPGNLLDPGEYLV